VASGELDDPGGERGSPARSDGVGRARTGAGPREMRRGSECGCGRSSKRSWGVWAGVVAEDSGDRRECARWSTAGAGRVEPTGEAHNGEREDGRAGAKKPAPTAWPHWQ
jgi:hypothetical protein